MNRHTFLYGFAIFSMFFGSGNLVFPLAVGVNSGEHWLAGFLGFFCTGIILPFLGLFVIKLHHGNYEEFFAGAGGMARIIIPLFTLSLLGSFGVIPRCITVAHGGIKYLFPEIPLLWFSIIFSISCFIICLNDKLMFAMLGKILTPILLLFLIGLIIAGVWYSPSAVSEASISAFDSFRDAFLQGYLTMDLFAAFFFSALIFKQIEGTHNLPPKEVIKIALKPSIFGAFLLAIIYLGFVFLGSHYADIASKVAPEVMLPAVAAHLLGHVGCLFIAVIIILSCLTTAIALNNIYAKYICSFKIIGDKYFSQVLFLTTVISFIISMLDFKGIAAILYPLLTISYPALIMLTILSIFTREYVRLKTFCFYGIIGIVLFKDLIFMIILTVFLQLSW